MSYRTQPGLFVAALGVIACSPLIAATSASRVIMIVNQSSQPIVGINVQASDYFMHDDIPGGNIEPGQSASIEFKETKKNINGKIPSSCIYDFINLKWSLNGNHPRLPHPTNVCKISKITIDDAGFTVESGGPGKGPITSPLGFQYPTLEARAAREWFAWATDTGCLVLLPSRMSKSDLRKADTYHWEGTTCRAGQFISGAGTLTVTSDLRVTSNKPGKGRNIYRGTMADGVWNGAVNHSDEYDGGVPPASDYGIEMFVMGCDPKFARDQTCFPHASGSVRPIVTP